MPKVSRARQTRGSSRSGAEPEAEDASASSRPRRSVLGDVSNKRTTRTTKNSTLGHVQKRTEQSSVSTTSRNAKAKPKSAADKKPAATTNSVSGESGRVRRSTRTCVKAQQNKKSCGSDETTSRVSTKASKKSSNSVAVSSRASSKGSKRSTKESKAAPSQARGRVAKRPRGSATAAAAEPKAKKGRTAKDKKTTAAKEQASIGSRIRSRSRSRSRSKQEPSTDSRAVSRSQTSKRVKKAPIAKNEKKSTSRGRVKPRSLCSDFVTHTDYKLVRKPFDASKYTAGIASHDKPHSEDVLEVSNYATDIFQRLYNAETRTRPLMYMDNQRDINSRMRAILIDWLVEVHMKFRLVPETLYLCVNIIDRYCNLAPVERSKLQLVGVTALLIACKYEEIYPPEVRDCVYITDRAYSRQDVLDMEQDIVQRLEFEMTVPTAYPFLRRFLHVIKAEELTSIASNYYMERTLQEHDLLRFRPSLVAAAAICLALNHPEIRHNDGLPDKLPGIPKELLEYTGFRASDILECAGIIATKVEEEIVTASKRELVAVKRKYDNRKYEHISTEFADPVVEDLLNAQQQHL